MAEKAKNTIKINESELKRIIAESIEEALSEYAQLKRPNNYVVQQFGNCVAQRAAQEGIQPNDEAILALAQRVYQENFPQYENTLINFWKHSGINQVKKALGPQVKSEPAWGVPGQKTDWNAVQQAQRRITPEMVRQYNLARNNQGRNPYQPETRTQYVP